MLRKLALGLAVSAALGVTQVHALGLGEIQLNSALNEPLDAEIKLTQVRDLSPLQIQPRIAASDEYTPSAAASQARYLRDIQFQVLVTPDGGGRIRLRSTEPIQEPFLNFMVEVNWPSGRMVREYTLLLDPPLFDQGAAQRRVQPAQAQPSAPVQPVAQARPSPRAGERAANIRTRMDPDTQVFVDVNDTLWEIAARTKPANVSAQQMMLALLRKNPAAFPSGNINALQAGMVLDLPTPEEAARLTHREAVAEVARQMQIWRERRTAPRQAEPKAPLEVSRKQESEPATEKKSSGAAGDDQREPVAGESAPGGEGKLKIVAPREASEPGAQTEAQAGSETITTEEAGTPPTQTASATTQTNLENDILVAQEKIDRLERENSDLNEKLNSVLEQLEAQSRLLELQSQQMATLQAELSRDLAAGDSRNEPGLLQRPAVLGGIGAGVVAILAALWLLLRRRRAPEPDRKRELVNVPEELRGDADAAEASAEERSASAAAGDEGRAAATAAAAAATAATADAVTAEAEPAEPLEPLSGEQDEFTRPPLEKLAPDEPAADDDELEQDLDRLDLEMDLDLNDLDLDDEPDPAQSAAANEQAVEEEADATRIDAAEFDLGAEVDEGDEQPSEAPAPADEAEPEPEPEPEEEGLEFDLKPRPNEEASSGPDETLADEEAGDLDFLLDDSADEDAQPQAAGAEATLDELEPDQPSIDNRLDETVAATDGEEYEIDPDLEAMLRDSGDEPEEGEPESADEESAGRESADDELDSLLASFEPEEEEPTESTASRRPGERVEQELSANISHDLEMDLDAEVEELLNSTDDEIALEERRNDEAVEILDKMNLLSGTDEVETKLDLARAYLEMDDRDGARDILDEITREGTEKQRQEAQKLLDSLS